MTDVEGARNVEEQPIGLRSLWKATLGLRWAVAAGAATGAIFGGFGARVVMRIIALADPSTDGVNTDAVATVGEITLEGTAELVLLGSIAGVIGGLVYLGVRRWLPVPPAWRGLAYGFLTLMTVGQLLFDTNNADFQIFEPVVLVLALFGILFFLNGLALAPLLDRLHPEPEYAASRRVSYAVTGVMALVCAFGLFAHAATTMEMIDDEGTCFSAAGEGNGCAVLTADVDG